MMKKVLVMVRDGWGWREESDGNTIKLADTPVFDMLMQKWPHTLLDVSGPAVGVPEGVQGNSEVGHMTIGAGRIFTQSLLRINNSIADGSFFRNQVIIDTIHHCKQNNSTLHIMGLLQGEGVHAHRDHLYALLDFCQKYEFYDVCIHVFTDGRDAPMKNSIHYIVDLQQKLKQLGFGKIVSVVGRYFSMDRELKWDRTKIAYDLIADGNGVEFVDIVERMQSCYADEITDEFVPASVLTEYSGLKDRDAMVHFNFRTDRTIQLTKAFVENEFGFFERHKKNIRYVAMTQYYDGMPAEVLFDEIPVANGLGEVVSRAGYRQLRISETAKYAHVTFFFNGQKDEPYLNEDRLLVDSPNVATYNLQPEMSEPVLTAKVIEQIEKQKYHLIVMNYPNCDMVGHSGDVEATKKAVEAVDRGTGAVVDACLRNDYVVVVLSDHGNAEDQTEAMKTSHTTNPVPCFVIGKGLENLVLKSDMGLQNIAPTVLQLMGISQPIEMSGLPLF